jgi:hypothetical protein
VAGVRNVIALKVTWKALLSFQLDDNHKMVKDLLAEAAEANAKIVRNFMVLNLGES